ncbi:MAG: ABC transporter ATP-binding protein [Alicyclobacillus sp.]|nr:ABC transporter ATP-binding protein [Alicyclobacillus sp.]
MLQLDQVSKAYDLLPVLEDISLTVAPGRTHWLVAPNGSGKTTLLLLMAGVTRPSRGRVLWQGQPLDASARRALGLVLQEPMLYADLTGFENLSLWASLYGVAQPRRAARQWLEAAGLAAAAHQRLRTYSKGMRQRLALCRALLHQPCVLLLDEPFDGLDGSARAWASAQLAQARAQGTALFVVTHQPLPGLPPDYVWTLRYGRLLPLPAAEWGGHAGLQGPAEGSPAPPARSLAQPPAIGGGQR